MSVRIAAALRGGGEESQELAAVASARGDGAQLGVEPHRSRRALPAPAHALGGDVHGGQALVRLARRGPLELTRPSRRNHGGGGAAGRACVFNPWLEKGVRSQ